MSREKDKMRRSWEAGFYSAPVKCTRKPRVGWERDGLRVDEIAGIAFDCGAQEG